MGRLVSIERGGGRAARGALLNSTPLGADRRSCRGGSHFREMGLRRVDADGEFKYRGTQGKAVGEWDAIGIRSTKSDVVTVIYPRFVRSDS